MPPPDVLPFRKKRPAEPTFEELVHRADHLAASGPTDALSSSRTVLMSLYLSAGEALDHLDDGNAHGDGYEQSLGAIGAYFIHACRLSGLPAGRLIADSFDRDEAELPPALKRAQR